MKKIVQGGAIGLAIALSTPALATQITFEELGPQTQSFSSGLGTPLTNQYAAQAVHFSGGWEVLNEAGGFGVNARSGEHFAAFNTTYPEITDTLTLTFDDLIGNIGGWVGWRESSHWTITAFRGAQKLAETQFDNPDGTWRAFELTNLAVNRITIHSNHHAGVLDDLYFQTSATVPEPGTLGLFSVALAVLGIQRRRSGRERVQNHASKCTKPVHHAPSSGTPCPRLVPALLKSGA
ncbi:PEP-CTERM sorting domain-containing protein [Marinobacteraceae bacterium S3BR75-40.1]